LIYVDTSAFLKLIIDEPESAVVGTYFADETEVVSSSLLVVEARRGTLRKAPRRLPRLDVLLERVEKIAISDAVLESAGRLPDPMLRSLDAIHLATALLIREDVDVFLTYDDRLATAARAHGIPAESPA